MYCSQEELNSRLRRVFEGAGYRRYVMSKFEEYDLYSDNRDFLASEKVLTFTDLDGRLMALKPDVTLSIVKNTRESGGIEKVYYHENVYRASGIGFKEISQAGLECIGEVDEYSVCEVLSLAAQSLMTIGESCELDISHLGLLTELIDGAGIGESAKKEVIRLMGEKNLGGLAEFLADEGAKSPLCDDVIALAKLDCDASEAPVALKKILGGKVSEESLALFCDTCEFLSEEFPNKVRVDFSTVGDLNYYSGIIFKGYVDGIPASVLSGGQYNGLMKKMKKKSRAIGFALYLDLLEPLFESSDGFDADILLIYDRSAAPREIYSAYKNLSADGKSVLVLPDRPKALRFREVYILSRGGVRHE